MKIISLYLIAACLMISCTSEDAGPEDNALLRMNLAVGNYWVYDWYETTPDGTTRFLNLRDSIFIDATYYIDGKTMFSKKGNFFGGPSVTTTLLFDSANSIYTYPDREVIFSFDKSQRFTKTFGDETDPVAIGYYALDDSPAAIQVPSGSFQAVNFRGRIEPQDPDHPHGIRYNDNYYARGVGLVLMKTQFFSSPNDIEMRLVRYVTVN